MKTKLVAYITAAVLMGFAVMMLPLALETTYPTFEHTPQSSTDQQQLRDTYGLASQPSITSSSLILIVGLILAFAAYIIVRKQVNRPDVFSFPYKPF
jgi:hypothetical protein